MKNNEWKTGDTVLCVKGNGDGSVKEGEEYIIDGFCCCEKCGLECIYLVGKNCSGGYSHKNCHLTRTGRERYGRMLFIKPDLSSLTAYKATVTVREMSVPKELKELTELQNQ